MEHPDPFVKEIDKLASLDCQKYTYRWVMVQDGSGPFIPDIKNRRRAEYLGTV